jgi:hypothetical protein
VRFELIQQSPGLWKSGNPAGCAGFPSEVGKSVFGLVGIEIGRVDRKVRVTILALSVARWVHSFTNITFPEAPL